MNSPERRAADGSDVRGDYPGPEVTACGARPMSLRARRRQVRAQAPVMHPSAWHTRGAQRSGARLHAMAMTPPVSAHLLAQGRQGPRRLLRRAPICRLFRRLRSGGAIRPQTEGADHGAASGTARRHPGHLRAIACAFRTRSCGSVRTALTSRNKVPVLPGTGPQAMAAASHCIRSRERYALRRDRHPSFRADGCRHGTAEAAPAAELSCSNGQACASAQKVGCAVRSDRPVTSRGRRRCCRAAAWDPGVYRLVAGGV